MNRIRRAFSSLRELPSRFEAAVDAADPQPFLRVADAASSIGVITIAFVLICLCVL
jgi:hypothetical protein